MEANAHYILENMKLQLNLQSRLLGLMKKKRAVMADRQVSTLEDVLAEEQVVVKEIKKLAEVRNVMVERFAGRFGLSRNCVELKSIGQSLQGQFRNAFDETLRGLSETAKQIVELNTLGIRVIAPPKGVMGNILSDLISGGSSSMMPEFGEKTQMTFPFPGQAGGTRFNPSNGMLLVLPHGGMQGEFKEFAAGESEAAY